MKCISVGKQPETSYVNEDAIGGDDKHIVVCDGAGGGGVYADKWAQYLVEQLPTEPICSFEELDAWVDSIWEAFYNQYEEEAKKTGGLLLDKFYDEGSFATLAAVWRTDENICHWVTYGDSVIFCYHRDSGLLEHSFGKIADFNQPPYLINYNDPLKAEGFRQGNFCTNDSSFVLVSSDALAHYILMMYEVGRKDMFQEELQDAVDAHSKNGNLIRTALSLKNVRFEKDVIDKLLRCIKNRANFKRHLNGLKAKGLLAEDDYSLGIVVGM